MKKLLRMPVKTTSQNGYLIPRAASLIAGGKRMIEIVFCAIIFFLLGLLFGLLMKIGDKR